MNIYALLAGLFSGIMGAMGLGGGTVLIIYLNLFTNTPQLKAQGINLIFFIPIAAVSVIIYFKRGEIKLKTVALISAFGLLGAVVGLWLTNIIGGEITAKLFGGLLILLGVKETFFKSVEKEKK